MVQRAAPSDQYRAMAMGGPFSAFELTPVLAFFLCAMGHAELLYTFSLPKFYYYYYSHVSTQVSSLFSHTVAEGPGSLDPRYKISFGFPFPRAVDHQIVRFLAFFFFLCCSTFQSPIPPVLSEPFYYNAHSHCLPIAPYLLLPLLVARECNLPYFVRPARRSPI